MKNRILARRALKILQVPDAPVYLFTLRAREVFEVAELSRVARDQTGELIGYQRPEVRDHVSDILRYIDGESPLFPNALIIALKPTCVRFEASTGPQDDTAIAGTIKLEIPPDGEHRPAWIVDGQQRALALSKAKNEDFVVLVSAFEGDTIKRQQEQFVIINNTRPLPRGLVTELLPQVTVSIPARLAAKKLPAALSDELAREATSPFHGIVRRASTAKTLKSAVVAENSLVAMLSHSVTNGCLFQYRNIATGEIDGEAIGAVLFTFWNAVKATFPEAWGKPPAESRLMHGVGIRAMGRVMDQMMGSLSPSDRDTPAKVVDGLKRISPYCHWTSGRWDELGLEWNQLENIHKHIQMLASHLIRLQMNGAR
ncbi:MAG TPA: DGQHR domain-containing protein DpdB [Chloroflexota bacterium]